MWSKILSGHIALLLTYYLVLFKQRINSLAFAQKMWTNKKTQSKTKTKRKEKRNFCHFHLFFNELFRISLNSAFILPRSGGESRGFIQGMLCAGKRRSCLPLFQGLITLATPEKHPFTTKDVFQDKKISLTVKASYTSQTVFPAALTIALPFGLIHLVLAK